MLHEISADGIAAYVTDLIVNPEDTQRAAFLAVAGRQVAVKGILANLVENRTLAYTPDSRIRWVQRYYEPYFMRIRKMPSGCCHGLALPKSAFEPQNDKEPAGRFWLIGQELSGIKRLFLFRLEQLTDLPLHASWADWLWALFEKQNWLNRLVTLAGSYQGYLCALDPDGLQDLISKAIRKEDPEIIACLKRPKEYEHFNH